MAKMGCAQCGGTKKMKAGGSAKVNISKRGAGFAKSQTGGSNIGSMIFGIPNAGMTGPNRNSVTETMKKGGVAKKVTTKLVKAKSGMSLKKVPSGKVGLAKLPTAVRNKMGYMKKGGPRKSLKRYQSEGEVMVSAPAPAPVSTKTFADTYKANLAAGLKPRVAKKEAEREMGYVQPKQRINPNSVIDAIGNVAGAAVSRIPAGGGGNPPPFKKGGTSKSVSKKPAMKKGGVTRKVMIKSKKK
jgi:hypothetical protein